MKIVYFPHFPGGTPVGKAECAMAFGEIELSLKRRATQIVCFLGCDLVCPGCIVTSGLADLPGEWVVCWVTKPALELVEWRAGLMPVPEGHTGPWRADAGWALPKAQRWIGER
jgi:hypothetical protein